jgi:hypothetical protein
MKKQLKKYNARVEDMKTSGDAAQFFKKDAQLDKAMNETFIPLDLATFETTCDHLQTISFNFSMF